VIRVMLRLLVAGSLAVSVHIALLMVFLEAREPLVLVEGGRIEVKFGAEGLNTAAAQADAGGGVAEPAPIETDSDADNVQTDPAPADAAEPESLNDQPNEDLLPTEQSEEETQQTDDVQPAESEPAPPMEVPDKDELAEPLADERPPADEAGTTENAVSDAGEQAADSVATAVDGSLTGDEEAQATNLQAGNAEADNYAGQITKILSRKRLPSSLRKGSAKITFTLNTDGSIEEIDVKESSGSRRFDREAVKLVEKAAPFPEPPRGIELTFTVVIENE